MSDFQTCFIGATAGVVIILLSIIISGITGSWAMAFTVELMLYLTWGYVGTHVINIPTPILFISIPLAYLTMMVASGKTIKKWGVVALYCALDAAAIWVGAKYLRQILRLL